MGWASLAVPGSVNSGSVTYECIWLNGKSIQEWQVAGGLDVGLASSEVAAAPSSTNSGSVWNSPREWPATWLVSESAVAAAGARAVFPPSTRGCSVASGGWRPRSGPAVAVLAHATVAWWGVWRHAWQPYCWHCIFSGDKTVQWQWFAGGPEVGPAQSPHRWWLVALGEGWVTYIPPLPSLLRPLEVGDGGMCKELVVSTPGHWWVRVRRSFGSEDCGGCLGSLSP